MLDVPTSFTFLISSWCERTFLADALVVDMAAGAFHLGLLHFHAEVFFHEVYGREYRQVGVALAATGTAVQGHLLQGARRHQVAEPPCIGGERRVAGDD